MKKLLLVTLLINLFGASLAFAKANCEHSHSWQCSGQAGGSAQTSQTTGGIAATGTTPNTGTTNTPLGTVTPTPPLIQVNPAIGHQIVKAPPTPVVQAPPQNVYPIPSQVITGQSAVPNATPMQVPPQTGGPVSQPTAIITHVGGSKMHPQVVLHQKTLHSGQKFEQAYAAVKDMHVDVYRGKDAMRMLYKDVLTMDRQGFHLTVLGIKEPTFIDTGEPVDAATTRDFAFYFDFSSAETKPEQDVLFGQILEEQRETGKRMIVIGETDGFGSEEYNRHLAVYRSTKIINRLKSQGIPDDAVELRVLVRCCRTDHPTQVTLAQTRDQRVTWVHFE
ncbi:MAG TPA: hypothetical protein VMW70_03845 [Burkholderiales bacterium]|nr:hypothetical protein [Burkholderiales bacterium]